MRTSEQLYYLLERSRQNVFNMGLFNSVHRAAYLPRPHRGVPHRHRDRAVVLLAYAHLQVQRSQLQHLVAHQGLPPRVLRCVPVPLQHARPQRNALRQGAARVREGVRPALSLSLHRQEAALGSGLRRRTSRGRTRSPPERPATSATSSRSAAADPPEWKGDVEATLRPAFDMRHAFRLGLRNADVLDSVCAMPTRTTSPREAPHQLLQLRLHLHP